MRTVLNLAYEDLHTTFDNISVRAVVLSAVLFFALPYVAVGISPYLASVIGDPIYLLIVIMQVFVPYLSLRLSYTSVSSEIDRETHRFLLTTPISRLDLVVSKLISRFLIATIGITFYTVISFTSSALFYEMIGISDVLAFIPLTALVSIPFVVIGISISCTSSYGSISSQIKLSATYIITVVLWRFVPVSTQIILSDATITELPASDYASWEYFLLKLNPIESYSILLSNLINLEKPLIAPSSLSLPNFSAGEIVTYPSSPLTTENSEIYTSTTVTTILSVLVPALLLAYGYYKLRSRDL